jgi:hypothetical protein
VVCVAPPRADARPHYDAWERIREPSHGSAWTAAELTTLCHSLLDDVTTSAFRLDADVEELIASCFPEPGGAERLRAQMAADVGVDRLDLDARGRRAAADGLPDPGADGHAAVFAQVSHSRTVCKIRSPQWRIRNGHLRMHSQA